MDDDSQPTRIEDNPSARAMSEALMLVKWAKSITGSLKCLGMRNEQIDRIYQAANEVVRQANVLTLPDRFNDAFADDGWIATGSMSADIMQKAVDLYELGKKQEAEDEILTWFREDTINLFAIGRAKKFNRAQNRYHQLCEALTLTKEERYWSAVPLILIACDGFASDVLGISPFEKNADLSVFDSITGHPSSLQFLIGKLTTGVRKSSDVEMMLPLRHGILHGKSLGYANRVVCMKAWLLMIALVDWAHDKVSEEVRVRHYQSTKSLRIRDLAKQLRKLNEDKRAIRDFEVRVSKGPFNESLDEDSPEFAIIQFLTYWKAGNYGKMANRVVNLNQLPISRMAGELRGDSELAKLIDFELHSVRHTTVVRAEAVAFLKGETLTGSVEGNFQVVALRLTATGDMAMPTVAGTWCVQQRCIYDLYQKRTISHWETPFSACPEGA